MLNIGQVVNNLRREIDSKLTVKQAAQILIGKQWPAAWVKIDSQPRVYSLEVLSNLLVQDQGEQEICTIAGIEYGVLDGKQSVEQTIRQIVQLPNIKCWLTKTEQGWYGPLLAQDLLAIASNREGFLSAEFKTVLDSIHNGVTVINNSGIVVAFNRAAERILGIPVPHAIGMHIEEILPTTGLLRVLTTGKPEVGEKAVYGDTTIIANRAPITADGLVAGAVSVFQDITEIERIANELETVTALKSTLEAALESAYEGIVIVDEEGRVTLINHTYAEFLGVDPKEVIGKHATEVVPNSRMHIVAKTGTAEIADLHPIGNQEMVVNRIPIRREGKIVGAVGKVLFRNVEDLKGLARRLQVLEKEAEYYREELRRMRGARYSINNIIGQSAAIALARDMLHRAAKTNSTVLVLGESGTGKELFAHALHDAGARNFGPFIKVNCAAVPEHLLESELFGYEEGAFTGAKKGGKPGKFELAHGGTIFLDEIGDMSLTMQAKLLRVLQDREVERVGATRGRTVDVRVVAATNRDLEEMIAQSTFRQDLYYRLNVITIVVPPLRERKEDIPLLVRTLLPELCQSIGRPLSQVEEVVLDLLAGHNWPGNVRELRNVLERAVSMTDTNTIRLEHLPLYLQNQGQKTAAGAPNESLVNAGKSWLNLKEQAEYQAIVQALAQTKGNKAQAARLLGLNRSWFYQKLRKYNLF